MSSLTLIYTGISHDVVIEGDTFFDSLCQHLSNCGVRVGFRFKKVLAAVRQGFMCEKGINSILKCSLI